MPDTLRVLYSFPHPLGGPGINNTAWQQVAGLATLDVDLTVYCTSLRAALPPSVRVVETLSIVGRRIPHRAIGVQRAYSYHDGRVAHALRTAQQFDIVHTWPRACLRTHAAAARAGTISLRELPNAHTALTFRESAKACADVGVELPHGFSHRFDAKRLAMEEKEFATADFLLAPSPYVVDSFREAGVEPHRVLQHQYGYDPEQFPPPPGARPDRPFTAAFVGRGEPPKGLHLALRAWIDSGVANHGRFLIAGRVLDRYAHVMAEHLAHPSVTALGFVADIGRLLRECDVLVFPTYTEGSALVTYEALASGAVPLVSNAAGALVHNGEDALVHDTGDVETLANQLRELHARPVELARLRQGALSRAPDLTWRRAAEQLLRAYEQAIAIGPSHDSLRGQRSQ